MSGCARWTIGKKQRWSGGVERRLKGETRGDRRFQDVPLRDRSVGFTLQAEMDSWSNGLSDSETGRRAGMQRLGQKDSDVHGR